MLKAVIFDCFGVLTVDLWNEYRMKQSKEVQPELVGAIRAYGSGVLSREELINLVHELVGTPKGEITGIIKPHDVKNTKLMDYIRELKKANYTVGILSNISNNWVTDEFLTAEEAKMFDDILLSYQVGVTKPDEKIYYLCAERLGLSPEECIFIDDQERNIWVAEDVGMKGIVYKSADDCIKQIDQLIHQ